MSAPRLGHTTLVAACALALATCHGRAEFPAADDDGDRTPPGAFVGLVGSAGPPVPAPTPSPPAAPGSAPTPSPKPATPAATHAPLPAIARSSSGHPRLVLTPSRLARAQRNVAAGTDAWRAVSGECDAASGAPIEAGYEAWDWGNAMASCAVAWHATGRPAYAATALRYLAALLDDRYLVGDGKGGDGVVRHDQGYSIRTFGFFAPLGYDWLHDAPGMTAALRARIVAREVAWLGWYAQSGYKRDEPVSNYFTGWFLAQATAGLAFAGEHPAAAGLEQTADRLFEGQLAPAFRALAGGDWPDGWQYGNLAAISVALYVDAQRTVRGRDRLAEIPWLREVVAHHTHALLPDGTAYDGGDWSERPARLDGSALDVLALVLPEGDPASSAARFLGRLLREARPSFAWLVLEGDEPGAPATDPRTGTPSYLAPGAGLVLARSDWTPTATFVSLQSGPTHGDSDHQHCDQGHFELVRGADALLVDPGDYGGAATLNHNSLLFDDRGASLDYAPNQGVWGRDARIRRFHDAGAVVYAEGDFADAYRPAKLPYGKPRTVTRAERSLLYVRPSTLVVYDRAGVLDPTFDVTWIAHAAVAPTGAGATTSIARGASRADVETLLPRSARASILKEPTPSPSTLRESSAVKGPSWRLEIKTPRGATERRLLHVVTAGPAGAPATPSTLVEGDAVDGALFGDPAARTLAIFPRDGWEMPRSGATWTSPQGARVVVTGLVPGMRYKFDFAPRGGHCLSRLSEGEGPAADEAGVIVVSTRNCERP